MEKVKKQYGLWTGIAMVVGIVIGSGVFTKAGKVLQASNGDLKFALLAWFVGGIIMVCSGYCFATYASRVTKYNGVIDYVEEATNKKVGYGLAWIMTTFYYPIIASIVALLAGQYFFQLLNPSGSWGITLVSWQNFVFAIIVLVSFVVLNYLSPMLAAKFQVSATVIKLVPIAVIAFGGLFASLIVGDGFGVINAFQNNAEGYVLNFGEAVKMTSFAYEGWVCATAINAELKDSKKNLSKALTFGTIAVLVFYIIYYTSLSSFLGNAETITNDAGAPIAVFNKLMPGIGSALFTLFIMISCLGTVNGVTISCCRGMYTMSCRGQGIMPEKFSKLGKNQSVSLLSCLYGLGCMLLMLLVWYLAFYSVWIFKYLGSMDEIVCAIIYGVYITLYIYIMRNFKECNVFTRYIMPTIATIGSLFFVICGTGIFQLFTTGDFYSVKAFGVFMLLCTLFTFPCVFFYNKDKYIEIEDNSNL